MRDAEQRDLQQQQVQQQEAAMDSRQQQQQQVQQQEPALDSRHQQQQQVQQQEAASDSPQQEQEQQIKQQQQQPQEEGSHEVHQQDQQQASATEGQQASAGLATAGLTVEQAADKTHEHAMAAMMGGGPPQWGGRFDNRSMSISSLSVLTTGQVHVCPCPCLSALRLSAWLQVAATNHLPFPPLCCFALCLLCTVDFVNARHITDDSIFRKTLMFWQS